MRGLSLTLAASGFISVESILVRVQLQAVGAAECLAELNPILQQVADTGRAAGKATAFTAGDVSPRAEIEAGFKAGALRRLFVGSKLCAKAIAGCGAKGGGARAWAAAGNLDAIPKAYTALENQELIPFAKTFVDEICDDAASSRVDPGELTCFNHISTNTLDCSAGRDGISDSFSLKKAATASKCANDPAAPLLEVLQNHENADSHAYKNWNLFFNGGCKTEFAPGDECKKELSKTGNQTEDTNAIKEKKEMIKSTCEKICTSEDKTDEKTKKKTKEWTCLDNLLVDDSKNNSKCKTRILENAFKTASDLYTKANCEELLKKDGNSDGNSDGGSNDNGSNQEGGSSS